MKKIFPGRYAAQIEGPFCMFLIGVRINRLPAIGKWIPVVQAMPPMLRELDANKELGFLHAETSIAWRGVTMIQYWRSFEHLLAYAHSSQNHHLPAWAAFNRKVGGDGTVGIWHETYQVSAGHSECVYANMPRYGLAAAAGHVPAVGRMKDAKSRMTPASG